MEIEMLEYIKEEYKEEISRLIAICIDFKIKFSDIIKDKILLNYIYALRALSKQYDNIYYEQKVYNEIYKKYGFLYDAFNKTFKKVLFCIKEIFKYLSNVFNYDIIEVVNRYIKDVKKCE